MGTAKCQLERCVMCNAVKIVRGRLLAIEMDGDNRKVSNLEPTLQCLRPWPGKQRSMLTSQLTAVYGQHDPRDLPKNYGKHTRCFSCLQVQLKTEVHASTQV